jgi:hypothetical protein
MRLTVVPAHGSSGVQARLIVVGVVFRLNQDSGAGSTKSRGWRA